MKNQKYNKRVIYLTLFLSIIITNFCFSQESLTLIKETQGKIKIAPENWKSELITLSEKFQVEDIDLKLKVMDILVRANTAASSTSECIRLNFIGQIDIDLLDLINWLKNSTNDFSFSTTLCMDFNEYKVSEIKNERNLKVDGFNLPNDLEFYFYDNIKQKNYNLKKFSKKNDNNSYSINLVNFKLKDKIRKIGDRQNVSNSYALVIKSKETGFRENINFVPETYDEEKAFYKQQERIAKGNWICEKVYLQPLAAIKNINTKIVLENRIKGDGDFGGDVTYNMSYKFRVSPNKKQLFLDHFSFKATECCKCHGNSISCGMGDFNGNNNSVWTSQIKKNVLLYEAPENFEFVTERINQNLIQESYLIKTKDNNGLFQRKRKPTISYVKMLYLKASTGGYDATIRGLYAWLRFSNSALFPLRRVDTCNKK